MYSHSSLFLLAALAVRATTAASTNCTTSGAHIIVTRESDAPPNTSAMNIIALGIVGQCAGSDIAETPYPAALSPYEPSEAEGVGNLTELVLDYQAECPDSKIVLLGYSQGAQVTADFLCGTSEEGWPTTEAYASTVTDNLAAVVLFGDPSFVKGLSWDRGTANNTSYFPRQNNTACDPVAAQIVSYCDYNDYYCDDGTSIEVHASYVERYHTEAVDWVVEQLGGC
ncbi:family 5 carbohydrate esterase [Cryphonectria parasitica EP155]|uniref:Family 5 carbohydrate esterase n=1 Tax=Cryphonectria parasitica (strain ATCC 38755 / EP155) TaxID=660469 RepID=A0A9P4Y477_CRYP1|nr:family 5 carbohydrate esterase [Cryphonectria parasitica EP155]KAF3766165.1 family 5 carbohydrate esterase [Cryphonectria parasitica EP155]